MAVSADSSARVAPWQPDSWRGYTALQQPVYEDPDLLAARLSELRAKPPLVGRGEVERLRGELAEAAHGRRFVLHGGDCAEMFSDCTGPSLTGRLKILLQMSLVLTYATRKPVIRVGRMAGQYAKPRSNDTEIVDGTEIPVYRGELVNGVEPTPETRSADADRLLEGYHHAAASLNYLRALIEGGFADLHRADEWDLAFIQASPHRTAYQRVVSSMNDAVSFLETIGGAGTADYLRRVELYTSHEALVLPFEESMTRGPDQQGFYNLGAHFLWAGMRTCNPEHAHIEYLRGIRNPVGVKLGPALDSATLRRLLERLDPGREPGRLTLITRFGAGRIQECLPPLIRTVRDSGHTVLWSCDAMHGNTEIVNGGTKTRRLEAVFSELEQAFDIHESEGSVLGGVHFELTADPVTECIGGSVGITEADLPRRYHTACDPRLNGAQALEMAFLIARHLR